MTARVTLRTLPRRFGKKVLGLLVWPRHWFSWVVGALVSAAMVLIVVPGQVRPILGPDSDEYPAPVLAGAQPGPLNVVEYAHGWPCVYLQRGYGFGGARWRTLRPAGRALIRYPSSWLPAADSSSVGVQHAKALEVSWSNPIAWSLEGDAVQFRIVSLIVDLAAFATVVLVSIQVAERWVRMRGRSLRFRLFDMLTVMTIVAAFFGWREHHVNRHQVELDVFEISVEHGVPDRRGSPRRELSDQWRSYWRDETPAWLRRLLGTRALTTWCRHADGVAVTWRASLVTDDQFETLRRLPSLESLTLVLDSAEANLAPANELDTSLTAQAYDWRYVNALNEMPTTECFRIRSGRPRRWAYDADYATLKEWDEIGAGEAIAILASLPGLNRVEISSSWIAFEELETLVQSPSINELHLARVCLSQLELDRLRHVARSGMTIVRPDHLTDDLRTNAFRFAKWEYDEFEAAHSRVGELSNERLRPFRDPHPGAESFFYGLRGRGMLDCRLVSLDDEKIGWLRLVRDRIKHLTLGRVVDAQRTIDFILECQNLKTLRAIDVPLDDHDLKRLSELEELYGLSIKDGGVTPKGVQVFDREGFNGLRIVDGARFVQQIVDMGYGSFRSQRYPAVQVYADRDQGIGKAILQFSPFDGTSDPDLRTHVPRKYLSLFQHD